MICLSGYGFKSEIVDAISINRRRPSISTIHLVNNFDVLIKGNSDYILRGYDEEAGMNFYKLYFEKES